MRRTLLLLSALLLGLPPSRAAVVRVSPVAGPSLTPLVLPQAAPVLGGSLSLSLSPTPLLALPALRIPAPVYQAPKASSLELALDSQLDAMATELQKPDDPLLTFVRKEGRSLLSKIAGLIRSGEIDPSAALRAGEGDPAVPAVGRELRVGVYPVAADPFQWGHILIALRAMAEHKLDKVVFVLAGDDPRKPQMTPSGFRHAMGRAVMDAFSPLFAYSSIAVGTQYDGETNIFRLLKLNPQQSVHAFYIVGGDHYRLKDKNGGDDTLLKMEKHLGDPNRFDADKHKVSLIFVERGEPLARIPTPLDIHFLPDVGFDASSTRVRSGHYELMPYAAFEFVRKNQPGLYGIR